VIPFLAGFLLGVGVTLLASLMACAGRTSREDEQRLARRARRLRWDVRIN
jgi:hypothetical protein